MRSCRRVGRFRHNVEMQTERRVRLRVIYVFEVRVTSIGSAV